MRITHFFPDNVQKIGALSDIRNFDQKITVRLSVVRASNVVTLVTDLSTRKSRFDSRSAHVRYMLEKVCILSPVLSSRVKLHTFTTM